MGFALGMCIDCGGGGDCFFFFGVILVAKNWCLWLSFVVVWLYQREREGKEMRVNCLYYLASKLYIEIKTRM